MSDAGSDLEGQPPQKRSRGSRAGKPLKFQCSYAGCEKRFSRAEHRSRHELNHNPKQIFHCDIHGCSKSFVRNDLFIRHRSKHADNETNHGTNATAESHYDGPTTHSSSSLEAFQFTANTPNGPGLTASSVPDAQSTQDRTSNAPPLTSSSYYTTGQPTGHPISSVPQYSQESHPNSAITNLAPVPGDHHSSVAPVKGLERRRGTELQPSHPSSSRQPGQDPYQNSAIADVTPVASDPDGNHQTSYVPLTAPGSQFATALPPSYLSSTQEPGPEPYQASAGTKFTSVSYNEDTHRQVSDTAVTASTSQFAGLQPGFPAQSSLLEPGRDHVTNDALIASQNLDTSWLPFGPTDGLGLESTDNFASWLFESPKSQRYDFDLTNLPYIDFGVDFSPGTANDTAIRSSVADLGIPATETWTPNTLDWTPDAHSTISESRRQDLMQLLQIFVRKSKRSKLHHPPFEGILFVTNTGELPYLSSPVLESCIQAFWTDASAQIAILHRWTFSCNKCHPLLLLAIISLGASALVQARQKASMQDYRTLADLITTHLRWEILTDDDSQPPVQLWVAQSLLLVEFHEKMGSTRKLHERAVIHHASTLTLLRRGSPLIGRAGSESPPGTTACPSPSGTNPALGTQPTAASTGHSRWRRWAKNEAMARVVYQAFQMDVLHAVMFGHEHQLAPFEIRLTLPCDDSLWNAKTAEDFQHLSSSFAMYGFAEQPSFLEALKQCMHGHEVQTHQNARLVLFSGLLSVGWHINRREKHLQFLDTVPSGREQARWRAILFNAFTSWKHSFETALARSRHHSSNQHAGADQPTTLYHLCHITLHVDLIDLQMLAGSKRLLSRKVSSKDRGGVIQRMRAWSSTPAARHAVLHSFKLLYHSIAKRFTGDQDLQTQASPIAYSCRTDPLIYRPWVLYLAALTIWAHEQKLRVQAPQQHYYEQQARSTQYTACRYITSSAELDNAQNVLLMTNYHGCMAVLEMLADEFANAESELLLEAASRLMQCRSMLKEGVWEAG